MCNRMRHSFPLVFSDAEGPKGQFLASGARDASGGGIETI